ncbi:MAG: GatB/YqeY domain-containing protein [Acidimicrobiia bacterium]
MTIQDQLQADLVVAMKAKDKPTLNVIRAVQTEVATVRAAPSFDGEVDDDLYLSTISTYVKRLTKSKAEYDAIGDRGAEQSASLQFEIEYLDRYLPTKLDEDSTRALVASTAEELGADNDTQPGMIIGAVMRSGEDVDGALVSRLVNEYLAD